MKKDNIIKIIKYLTLAFVVILVINICLAESRIGHYSVLTPLEDLTFTERIAAKLNNSSFRSREDLKKDGLLQSDETIKKDNIENLNKKETLVECNYSKHELESMHINSSNFIGKELKFTGVVVLENNATDDKDIDVFVVKIANTDVLVTMICDKNKVDYSKWKRGTNLNIDGYIQEIKEDKGTSITLKKNPSIIIK